jgi:thioesterase domain-containing protein
LAGQHRSADDLPGLARSYLTDLRALQRKGPYRLGGWSMGALIAYELAKELERQGEAVELLILLDAPFALQEDPCRPEELARYFVADSLRTVGRPEASVEAAGVEQHLDHLAALLDSNGASGVRAEVGRRFEAFSLHRRLMSGYRPDGAVRAPTLLIGAQHSPNAAAQPRWQALLPNVEQHIVDADHYTLLRPEAARYIAELVEKVHLDAHSTS